ncbi:MAG TPA: hypothetical protein VMG12_27940, partial [Polyangiaceae bacterium]|nr:hypothetical protein [Polyangiaceae bacterium]
MIRRTLCTSASLALVASINCTPDAPAGPSFEQTARDISSSSEAHRRHHDPEPPAPDSDAGIPAHEGDPGTPSNDAGSTEPEPPAPSSDAGAPVTEPDAGPACVPHAHIPSSDGAVDIDPGQPLQTIQGFGGINVPGWIADLTPEQVDTAFGNGPGQIGMSILRVRVPFDPTQFALEVPTAQHALALGAKVIASPWSPPA